MQQINPDQKHSIFNLTMDMQKLSDGAPLESVKSDLNSNLNLLINSDLPFGVKEAFQKMSQDVASPSVSTLTLNSDLSNAVSKLPSDLQVVVKVAVLKDSIPYLKSDDKKVQMDAVNVIAVTATNLRNQLGDIGFAPQALDELKKTLASGESGPAYIEEINQKTQKVIDLMTF